MASSIHLLEFWDPLPVLIGADVYGGLLFFAVMPLRAANTGRLLHAFQNDHRPPPVPPNSEPPPTTSKENKKKKDATCVVTCMRVVLVDDDDKPRYLLFTGDEQGMVRVWDLTDMAKRLQLTRIPHEKCKWARRGYHPMAAFTRDFEKERTAQQLVAVGTGGNGTGGEAAGGSISGGGGIGGGNRTLVDWRTAMEAAANVAAVAVATKAAKPRPSGVGGDPGDAGGTSGSAMPRLMRQSFRTRPSSSSLQLLAQPSPERGSAALTRQPTMSGKPPPLSRTNTGNNVVPLGKTGKMNSRAALLSSPATARGGGGGGRGGGTATASSASATTTDTAVDEAAAQRVPPAAAQVRQRKRRNMLFDQPPPLPRRQSACW